jgi:hypothetical protein
MNTSNIIKRAQAYNGVLDTLDFIAVLLFYARKPGNCLSLGAPCLQVQILGVIRSTKTMTYIHFLTRFCRGRYTNFLPSFSLSLFLCTEMPSLSPPTHAKSTSVSTNSKTRPRRDSHGNLYSQVRHGLNAYAHVLYSRYKFSATACFGAPADA